ELEKLKVPCLCPLVRPQRALPAGVGERGEGYQQGVLGEVFSEADEDTMSSFQISSAKARWPCSVKCTPSYARPTPHAPASAKRTPSRSANARYCTASSAEASIRRCSCTHAPKATGGGAMSKILSCFAVNPARKRSILCAVSDGVLPCSRSLVPSITINKSVSAGKAGVCGGISRPFIPQF